VRLNWQSQTAKRSRRVPQEIAPPKQELRVGSFRNELRSICHQSMVPEAGIEPARLAAGDFESPASTNFTTRADCEDSDYDIFFEKI
jgi:hypothetical protein